MWPPPGLAAWLNRSRVSGGREHGIGQRPVPERTFRNQTRTVVVVATRSGSEVNATRFGLPFAEALSDPTADLDHDGRVSVLEAFRRHHEGSRFYQTAGRLATEHALLDDSRDGLGTPADWFRGGGP